MWACRWKAIKSDEGAILFGRVDRGILPVSQLLPPLRISVGRAQCIVEGILGWIMQPPAAGTLQLGQIAEALEGKRPPLRHRQGRHARHARRLSVLRLFILTARNVVTERDNI